MHLLIPFATPLSEAGRAVMATLQLPHLQALASVLAVQTRDDGDEWSLSPPHERALARALGWRGTDGLLPWAAHAAAADGIELGGQAWALLSPVHWHLGTDQVSLVDPAQLQIDDATSRSFFGAVQHLFTSEGYGLAYGSASRWYIAHSSLATLPTASLDRVIGRNVDRWLGHEPGARRLRRLQGEVQMLLYTHPLNDQRIAHGLLPVNSFWLSGCGALQPQTGAMPTVDERLRAPALADDWASWAKAWQTLDEGPLALLNTRARAGQAVQLTLCGERAAATLGVQPRGLLQRLRTRLLPPPWATLLETL
ncbi:MAG: hypothetical protein LH480_00525 [Rubrivivax sp.]|nr:hypothetical protein [Rubrivivax sp.]